MDLYEDLNYNIIHTTITAQKVLELMINARRRPSSFGWPFLLLQFAQKLRYFDLLAGLCGFKLNPNQVQIVSLLLVTERTF